MSTLILLIKIAFITLLAYILLLIVSSLLVNKNKEYNKKSPYYRLLLNSASGLMTIILGIKVNVTGLEKLPKGRFLIVSNHRSNFDPILTWYMLKDKEISYVSKEENFHIPIFGRIIRKCNFMTIDRENPRNALKTINRAIDLLNNDIASIGIYPEGTRSFNCTLLPFHNGVFKIAKRANVPIVVMTIEGTEKIHKNIPFNRTEINLDILKTIGKEEVDKLSTNELGEEIYTLMENNLNSNYKSHEEAKNKKFKFHLKEI